MRIAVVAPNDLPVPPIRGGAVELTITALAEQWVKGGHEVEVYSLADPSLPGMSDVDGVTHIRIPKHGPTPYVLRCADAVTKREWDVILVFNRPGWMAAIKAKAPRTPVVLSLHSRRMGKRWLSPREGRACVRAADAIVTVSGHLRSYVCRLYPAARPMTFAVHTGVDTRHFRPARCGKALARRNTLRQELGLNGRRVFLYAGRLTPAKGIDLLLKAMVRVVRESPDASLLVCGSNWIAPRRRRRRGQLRKIPFAQQVRRAAAKLDGRVAWAGFVPPDRIHELFWAADVLVAPSRFPEPLARVLYEGMATGLPVVTTFRGGNPEVIHHGENGLLVRRTDTSRELARSLLELVRDPALARNMGRAGRNLALSEFRWKHAADRWERVFEFVIGRGS